MNEERVLKLVNTPGADLGYRPEWLPEDAEPTHALLELGYCMEYNPAPFEFADIESAVATHTDADPPSAHGWGLGEREWVWDVLLKDGRRFKVDAWHDYSGWDCQSGATYELAE